MDGTGGSSLKSPEVVRNSLVQEENKVGDVKRVQVDLA